MEEKDYLKYKQYFSPESLFEKLKINIVAIGEELIIKALELYYATQNPEMSLKNKLQVYGVLGYLILPLDFIPDYIPMLGYSDDLAALMYAIALVEPYINEQVREQARERFSKLTGTKKL